jgi:primosomal protein N' (replication factor Y)
MYACVALNIPADKLFTYEIPENLAASAKVGKRVYVPFGHRKRTGYIVSVSSVCDVKEVKSISEILDEEPLFDAEDLKFYEWIASYFIYPLGKTLAELIPAGPEKKETRWVFPADRPVGAVPSSAQRKLLDIVYAHPQGLPLHDLAKKSSVKNHASLLRSLQRSGLIRIEKKDRKLMGVRKQKIIGPADNIDLAKLTLRQQAVVNYLKSEGPKELREVMNATHASSSLIKKLLETGVLEITDAEMIRKAVFSSTIKHNPDVIVLTREQKEVSDQIHRFISTGRFHPVLLHGVTGSGKTEVYLSAIEYALKANGTAIYLVPEIALTPQLIARISGRFDENRIAVIHSGIAEGVRYDQWREIRRGRIDLVIGARSALFAPLPNLKLIVVDEEHDTSYKQDERLCYHARDLAVVKGKLANAVVLLGSATPGVRTFFNAETSKYTLLELRERINKKPLPRIDIIDMKLEKEMQGKTPILSRPLLQAITETLQNREQALLFLNKRGFDTFLVCGDCGYHLTCPNCAVALKSHLAEHLVKCHYCDYQQKAIPLCPNCRGSRILNYGTGTQKLEKELESRFPHARTCRMDSDTTTGKDAQEKILYALQNKEIDILVGTQMIAKGHDFPSITLVGVISADTSLNLPDFRAAEKTFQMLTQVAGRGGRGERAGRVIIQTFNPDHYALKHAGNHDYKSFYREELEYRRALAYPPFSRMINVRLSSAKLDILTKTAVEMGQDAAALCAKSDKSLHIIGPAESPLSKIRGEYRMQLILKGTDSRLMHTIAAQLADKHATSTVKIVIDVDPENFM